MVFDQAILRPDAEALIEEEISREIIQGIVTTSAALSMFRRLPNMSTKDLKMPVLNMFPTAFWVDGDVGIKQTTKMAWASKWIHAEKLAVIVPVAESVLDDVRNSGYDLWAEVTPRVIESFGVKIDEAIFFGIDKPITWRDDIVTTATNAGNTVPFDADDMYQNIFGIDGLMSLVEKDGFNPNGLISDVALNGVMRSVVDLTNRPLFIDTVGDTPSRLGPLIFFNMDNGAWDNDRASMIVGDMSQAVFSIRQDITMTVLRETVINDNTGSIIFNFAQNDMIGLRFVMRLGWEIPNPRTRRTRDKETSPFAIMLPPEPTT
ncbi:MAG: phage major capsid protein [Firmicutes bacterium]|nr:phage major capsid protein [Bacillota bacterium]